MKTFLDRKSKQRLAAVGIVLAVVWVFYTQLVNGWSLTALYQTPLPPFRPYEAAVTDIAMFAPPNTVDVAPIRATVRTIALANGFRLEAEEETDAIHEKADVYSNNHFALIMVDYERVVSVKLVRRESDRWDYRQAVAELKTALPPLGLTPHFPTSDEYPPTQAPSAASR